MSTCPRLNGRRGDRLGQVLLLFGAAYLKEYATKLSRLQHQALWLEEHKERIEVFYLPAYSPELNPDEYLNNDLKQTIASDGVAITQG